jgi:glutamate--cysteine ligase
MELREAVHRAFRPASRPGRLGVEVELIPVTHIDPPRGVDPAQLAFGFDADFVNAARPTFEPGGQLELSPPPRWSVAEVVADVDRLLARATSIAQARGIRLEAVGTNPYQSCADIPLRTPTPRYLAMQDEFDRVGSDGRRMMRLTASLQISVDLLPGTAGVEQWLVANLAGPGLTVAFANSTAIDGRPTAIPGARTRIWLGVDHRRTAYDGRNLDLADPIGAYASFAADAPRLRIPASADPAYHLSTLFPPVRPRGGYLELRYLDAQSPQRFGVAFATVAHLLYDRQARRDALDLLRATAGNLEQAWISAGAGHSPDAADLLSIAAAGRPAEMLVAGGAS